MASESSSVIRSIRSTVQFEIDYSEAANVTFAKTISSPKFTACGYDWCLKCFRRQEKTPKDMTGNSNTPLEEKKSYATLCIFLQSEVKEISVESSIKLLDKNGNFIPFGNPRVLHFKSNKGGFPILNFIPNSNLERDYSVNGILVILYSIKVLTDPKVVRTYPGGLYEHIQKLWEKKDNFDVTFEVEGESVSAHKFMLAARSPVFEKQLFGPMAETKEERIKIKEMKVEVFKALLHFVYTDELAKDATINRETLSVELLQGLFVAADRYGLEKLTLLCEEKLENNFSVDTVVTTLLLADRHSRTELKKKCLDFASSPDNFSLVALTEGYLSTMLESPSLLAELSEKVKCMFHSAKKPRTD